jgi:hypothetical protein
MTALNGDDPQLAQVKTVLRRLQRLPVESTAGETGANTEIERAHAESVSDLAKGHAPAAEEEDTLPVAEHSSSGTNEPLVEQLTIFASDVAASRTTDAAHERAPWRNAGFLAVALLCGVAVWMWSKPPNGDRDARSPSPPSSEAAQVALPTKPHAGDSGSGRLKTNESGNSVVAARPPVTPQEVPQDRTEAARPAAAPPSVTGPAGPTDLVSIIAEASTHLSAGRVAAARSTLLANVDRGSADIAWALARAFDPNVLSAIRGADSSADAKQADRWYREWHALAVKQGLVTDRVVIDGLLRSLR